MRRRGGLSLFAQTMLLLLLALVLGQAVIVAMILVRPPPRPEIRSLSEISDSLAGRRGVRSNPLIRTGAAAAPVAAADMIENPQLTALLARSVGRAPQEVRLYFQVDPSASFPFRRRRHPPGDWRERGVVVRHGEPLFFNAVVAGARDGARWRVVRTPPAPFLTEWQLWTLAWFGLSSLLLLPIAWLFARRVTRPMRRFVEVADRYGRDEHVAPLPIEGPAEMRTTAEALNRMQARIDEHISERTSMIGAIAHDLRTPLARIAFRIEAAPDAMREKVQGDVEQMRVMIAQTIAFVRSANTPLVRERIDLAALIGTIARNAAETGRPVRFAGAAPAWVMGDALALERLIDNLVNNAVAFAGEAEIMVDRVDGRAEVAVRDRGPGLSEAMLSRAFEPFERGEPSRSRTTGGVGLGLTIARAIARTHGGTLTLANRAGGGLVACFGMPLA